MRKAISCLIFLLFLTLFPQKLRAISSLNKVSQNPIITTASGTWENLYVHAPNVIFDNGTYKMWYAGHNIGGTWKVGYATSTDGVSWTKYSNNPVFSSNPLDPNDNHTHTPRVIKDGSIYKMWYTASPDDSSNFTIRYATSSDGINWTRGGQINMPSQSWETVRVYPFVLKVGSEYKLWYTSNDGSGWKVGYATSTDGVNWTPYAGNPVLTPTKSWEGNDIDGASVLYDGTTYEIFYHGSNNLSYATSTDGINWTKPADKNPVLTRGSAGSFDSSYLAGASALRLSNGTTLLYYGGRDSSGVWRIGLAKDGEIPSAPQNVIIVPGMFASWNRDAVLHNSTVSQSDWKLNTSVSEYNGLISTLKTLGYVQDTSLFIFTYDWRKKLEDIADDLNGYINSKIASGTKVALVGHSLGGLVARIYAQKYGTGKVHSLITVGSPHRGVPQVYKVVAGGEIDRENILQWLATKLILFLNKEAGKTDKDILNSKFPVAKDLLPTYDFLQKNDGSYLPVAAMTIKNDTLPSYNATFSAIFNVFSSIYGNIGSTPFGFTTSPPSPSDIAQNLYPDGHPEQKISANGDRTVTAQSAQADTDYSTLSADHTETIYKANGIGEILSKLNITYNSSQITEGSKTGLVPSLLFFIRSVAEMEVTAPAGQIIKETDGMIFIQNAAGGDYTLKVKGKSQGIYKILVVQIIEATDYWENIEGAITSGDPASETDAYVIHFPSSPLFPKSSGGTGGGSISSTPTPTPTPTSAKTAPGGLGTAGVMGITTEKEASESTATPSEQPIPEEIDYIPQPEDRRLVLWFIPLGILLLLLAKVLKKKWGAKK